MTRRVDVSDLYGGPNVSPGSMTEAQLRNLVVSEAHRQGWIVFSLPIAKTRRPVKDAVGYPDLTLARDGEVRWIELKQDGGALSPAQWDWHKALGFKVHVLRPRDWRSGRCAEALA